LLRDCQEIYFEKEIQKALRVIFQNIQALEDNRDKKPACLADQDLDIRVKRQQRKLSVPVQRPSYKSVGQPKSTQRKKRGFTV